MFASRAGLLRTSSISTNGLCLLVYSATPFGPTAPVYPALGMASM